VSHFAVFDENNRNLGAGKTEDEAVEKACETLAAAGAPKEWREATLIEWCRGDTISSACWLHPDWNGSHLTGQS